MKIEFILISGNEKSLNHDVIDNYIIIRTLLLSFLICYMSFFESKFMSMLSRCDIGFYQCTIISAILFFILSVLWI